MSKAQQSKGCFSKRSVDMSAVPIHMERGVPAGDETYEHAAYRNMKAKKKREAEKKREANALARKAKHPSSQKKGKK